MGKMGSRQRHDYLWGRLTSLPLVELNQIGLLDPVTLAEVARSCFTPDFDS